MTDAATLAPEVTVRPLGGCGEVGLNATLIHDGGDAILIDCGVSLATEDVPGVERLVPDFALLRQPGRTLHAVLLTHGHEDHIGALPELFLELDVPVYGPPLAILLAKSRFERRGMPHDHLHAVPLGEIMRVGPFEIEWVRVTHSIPDSAALVIETRAGRILHTGDFKIDVTPIDGRTTDLPRLAEIAARGVDLMLSDSTNAEVPGRTRSEAEVGLELERVAKEAEQRLIVTCFASHLHRLQGLARAAKASRRKVVLLGSSLHRAWHIGTRSGHLDLDAELAEDYATVGRHHGRDTMVVVTGAQGEPRAALGRIALERAIPLGAGDRVVLSTSTIPGNEKPVRRIVNALALMGAQIIDDGMCPVHCSGHAHQGEQAELIVHMKPRWFVPIHGDRAMLEAHARTARAVGVENTIVIEDGESVVLTAGRVVRGDVVPMQARAIDASTEKALAWPHVEARKRMAYGGVVTCALALADRAVVGAPMVAALGWEASPALLAKLAAAAGEAVDPSSRAEGTAEVVERVRAALRREIKRTTGARPSVEVTVLPLRSGFPAV